MKHLPTQNSAVAQILLAWYDQQGRSLPWRGLRNPYAIWLSEIILQQTRVEQGLPYWQRFLRELPTLDDLARAEPEVVKGLWSGLGYYRRADLLHRASKHLVEHGWPSGYEMWRGVPGVGPYTAGALASILDGEPVPALDGNAYRVYARLSDWRSPIDSAASKAFIAEFAGARMPAQRPGDFNQAIMDLAQALCVPRKPRCPSCPISDFCLARQNGSAEGLPTKVRNPKVRAESWHFAVAHKDGQFGLVQRPASGIWSGLFAPVQLNSAPNGLEPEVVTHRLSHRALTLNIYKVSEGFADFTHWMTPEEWRSRGMPQAFVHWMAKFTYI